MRTPKGHASSGLVTSAHVRSRWTRPYHGGYGQSRRARLATAVHVGHVDVASSIPGLGCSPVWMSVHPAMRSILYGSRNSSITLYCFALLHSLNSTTLFSIFSLSCTAWPCCAANLYAGCVFEVYLVFQVVTKACGAKTSKQRCDSH